MIAGSIELSSFSIAGEALIKLALNPTGLANIPFDESNHFTVQGDAARLSFVQQRRLNYHVTTQSTGIVFHQPSCCHIVAWARIDNREELRLKIDQGFHDLCDRDDGLILAAYLNWGEDCTKHLIGDFIFAIHDGREDIVFCARDHFGVKPFYYYFDGKLFVFASSLAVLTQIPILDLSISQEWLAKYLLGISQDWTQTTYKNIYKLAPAHQLLFVDHKPRIKKYFTLSNELTCRYSDDQDYVDAYRSLLNQSVECRIRSAYPIGSELSGGLDSSTITALASQLMPNPGINLHAFVHDSEALTFACVKDLCRIYKMRMVHMMSKTQTQTDMAIAEYFDSIGAPVEHGNAISYHRFYQEAQSLGIRTLLSGFGGDEFVTSAAPVALVEFWRDRNLQLFMSRQRGGIFKPLFAARWIYHYYRHKNQSYTSLRMKSAMKENWRLNMLKDEVCKKYQLKEAYLKEYIYDSGMQTQNDFAILERWSPLMTSRLESSTLMAARHGIEYRWPLLDIRLVKFFLSVPASQKLGPGGVGRFLHHRAVDDLLPDSIVWTSKDMEKVSIGQKILHWVQRWPLCKRIEAIFDERKDKRASPNDMLPDISGHNLVKIESQSKALKRDPRLEPLIDKPKFDRIKTLAVNMQVSKSKSQLARNQLKKLRQLNAWLKYFRSQYSSK